MCVHFITFYNTHLHIHINIYFFFIILHVFKHQRIWINMNGIYVIFN